MFDMLKMSLSPSGEPIKSFEGLRLTGYLPTPEDKPTIGWGHTGKLLDGSPVTVGETITLEEAEALFRSDIEWAEKEANAVNEARTGNLGPASCLFQNQFDALTSLIFNVGAVGFRSSKLRKAIIAGDDQVARAEWADWCHQAGKVLPGLVKRRTAEWALWENAHSAVS